MRTTLNIDDDLLKSASVLTGVKEKTSLIRAALKALIAQESAKRLASLGGSEPDIKSIPRRQMD
ncbi:MAG: type II toxin-antitoxin system VapB family antitoxin [Gammaproteobacteria bacterium]|nr:type II toxin-antitoxin system VapB family antitoxin [Gammaproteobacteria bacterium]